MATGMASGNNHVNPQPPTVTSLRGSRGAAALLALGIFGLLAGGIFLLPFALSPYAIQNDVYMSNLFVGPPTLLAGLLAVLAGLLRLGLSHASRPALGWVAGRAALLAVAGVALVVAASYLIGGHYASFDHSIAWPPYLNLALALFTLVTGATVGVAGWVWGGRPTARALLR